MVIFCQSKTELYLILEVKGSNPIEVLWFFFLVFFPGLIIYNIYYLFNFIYICHMYLYYKCPTEVYFTGYHERVAVLFIME